MFRIAAECALENGVTLQIVHGNIVEEETDAIVNAANERLQHGGGVAGAILRAGGRSIQEESDAIGFVPTGSAAVTGAGTLKTSYIIHAVGPVWRGGAHGEEGLLESAVLSALEAAARRQLVSVALPAISSGIFGFPKDRCAEIIIGAVRAFASRGPTPLRLMRCTNIDLETVNAFQRVIESITY